MPNTPPCLVIGAGIVGILTAYALAKRGRSVVLIDRTPAPARMCSHGNAGILAVGHAKAWAGPGAIPSIARAVLGRAPGVTLTRPADPALWRWGASFLGHCSRRSHTANTAKLQKLSRYSRDMTASVEADLGLTSALRHEGALYIFRNDAQFASYAGALSASGDSDVQVLGREALIAKEPSLAAQADRIAGGFFSPHDSVGDCRLFASRVATALTERHDVTLLLGAEVTGFERRAGKIEAVVTDRGAVPAETVVLATGAQTPALTRRLGFAPNIYPVKGYSGTWHAPEDARLPRLPFIDETELMAVAAYGGLLRVTAQAEFAGHDRSLPADRTRPLRDYVARAFGDAVNPDAGEFWCGLRPSTPAGPPFLGRIREFDNLWINAGHGQLGWTMAAGCAALLAGHITGHGAALAGISSRARWLEDI